MERVYSMFQKAKMIGVFVSGVAILGMMIAIVADVISRNITGSSILGVYEVTQNYLMIAAIFPALPYVYSEGIMPKMELLLDKVSVKIQEGLIYFILLLEVIAYTVMFYYSLQYALTGFEGKTGFMAGGKIYPLYPILFLIPISFISMLFETIFIIVKNIRTKRVRLTVETKEESYF